MENWNCTKWSSCEGGKQIRRCFDLNACGTKLIKPIEERPCKEQEGKGNLITGAAIGGGKGGYLILVIFLVIVGITYIIAYSRKTRGNKSKRRKR